MKLTSIAKINFVVVLVYTFLTVLLILSMTMYPGLLGLTFKDSLNASQISTLIIFGSISSVLFLSTLILGLINSFLGIKNKNYWQILIGSYSLVITLGVTAYIVLFGPYGLA